MLLVHGAWSCAEAWGKVPALLQARGHDVAAVDLPGNGVGSPVSGNVGLQDCVSHVVGCLQGDDTVLIGHSMGGMVISGVAEQVPERLARTIYVTAFLPRNGDSLLRLKKRESQTIGPTVQQGEVPGTTVLDKEICASFLFQDATANQQALGLTQLCPQPNAVQTDRLHLTGERFGRVPRSYVVCTLDRTVTPSLQRRMIAESPCDCISELECGHYPQLTSPEALASEIDRLAG